MTKHAADHDDKKDTHHKEASHHKAKAKVAPASCTAEMAELAESIKAISAKIITGMSHQEVSDVRMCFDVIAARLASYPDDPSEAPPEPTAGMDTLKKLAAETGE